jgi:hypothetical protein
MDNGIYPAFYHVNKKQNLQGGNMSELKQSFKKAMQAFTHASDFIVPLYEDAYLIAEDISDEMAAERNLYEQDYETQQLIENEIEGAVAFFSKLTASFLLVQISLLEDCLLEICEVAAQERKISFSAEKLERWTAERAKQFLEHELGIEFPSPWPTWEKVQEVQRLRDQIVGDGTLEEGSAIISDRFLVDVNETIIAFWRSCRVICFKIRMSILKSHGRDM